MSKHFAAIQTATAAINAGNEAVARSTLLRVLQKDPGDFEANKLMAMLHGAREAYEQAAFHLKRAIAKVPNDPQSHFMLGNVLLSQRKLPEAIKAYQGAVGVHAAYLDAWMAIGRVRLMMGEYAAGVEAYEQGIVAVPHDPAAYRMYAADLAAVGYVDEGLAVLHRGVEALPESTGLRESLCYNMNFLEPNPAAERREHEAWGVRALRNAPGAPVAAWPNTRDAERPLRVGFVSADFQSHACALFLMGLLGKLNRSLYEPYLYYTRVEGDSITSQFERMGHWRGVYTNPPGVSLRDRALGDGIDVLIDTSGLTADHGLGHFVPRASPVQMTWLGYPNTTGLPTMDYRIVDAITDPPMGGDVGIDSDSACTERLIRLGRTFVCFAPAPDAPEPKMTPALAGSEGPITFCSFNRLSKVREDCTRTWARVLKAAPNTRLFLKSGGLNPDVRRRYEAIFAAEGVDLSRVSWSGWVAGTSGHLAAYHQGDIALDSFPYNGTTTTCEATWMGLPVVTLVGRVHRSRVGASLLTALGLPELVAQTEEEYIAIAAGLAADRERLRGYHTTLRARMAASPLCDHADYARHFERAIRDAWSRWCREPAGGR